MVHTGRAIAEATLETAGIMTISTFSGSLVAAAILTKYQTPGYKYKAKRNELGEKGKLYTHNRKIYYIRNGKAHHKNQEG